MTTTTTSLGSLLIVCCLAFTRVMAVAAAAVATAVADGVIDAIFLIVAIEREGSKLSINALR